MFNAIAIDDSEISLEKLNGSLDSNRFKIIGTDKDEDVLIKLYRKYKPHFIFLDIIIVVYI